MILSLSFLFSSSLFAATDRSWNIRVQKYTKKTLAIAVELPFNDDSLYLHLSTLNKRFDGQKPLKSLPGKDLRVRSSQLKKAAKKNSTTGLWTYILQVDLPIISRDTILAVVVRYDPQGKVIGEKKRLIPTKSKFLFTTRTDSSRQKLKLRFN